MDASQLLNNIRLVPVVVIEDVNHAVPLAITLRDAGIQAIEITLRSSCALSAIDKIAREVPELIVGAGSVRHTAQFADIISAGARFGVSPGASELLLNKAAECNLPFVPGAETASEMVRLLERGYELQKFFPAELSGGVKKLKALSAPLPEIRFFPTGGITAALAPTYLAHHAVACIGGSWFIPDTKLSTGDFTGIGELAEQTMKLTHAW